MPSCLVSKSELISNKRDYSTRVKRERPLLSSKQYEIYVRTSIIAKKISALGSRKIRIRSLPVVSFFLIKNKIGAHCNYVIKNNVILLKSIGSDKPCQSSLPKRDAIT